MHKNTYFVALLNAMGDLAANFAVGFFFLAAAMLTGVGPLAGIQVMYTVASIVVFLLLVVVALVLKVYAVYKQVNQP